MTDETEPQINGVSKRGDFLKNLMESVKPRVYDKQLVGIPIAMSKGLIEFSLPLPHPATVLDVFFAMEQSKVFLANKGPKIDVQPVLFVDIDPTGHPWVRSFVFMPAGMGLQSEFPLIPLLVRHFARGPNDIQFMGLYEKQLPSHMRTPPDDVLVSRHYMQTKAASDEPWEELNVPEREALVEKFRDEVRSNAVVQLARDWS